MNAELEPGWLSTLARTVPVGIVVIDSRGTVIWCNDEALGQFRYSRESLVGLGVECLVPQRLAVRHVSMRQHYAADPVARPMGTGRELFGLRSDNTEFPLEIGLRSLVTPDGTLYVASIVDVTARQQAEATFLRVIEAAPCGMLVVDKKHRIVLVNNHLLKTFGYAQGELEGKGLELLIPERHRHTHSRHAADYSLSPTDRAMGPGRDLTGRRKNGTEFPVEIGLRPVAMESGTCVLATVIDVTERKRVEQQLRRANTDLEEFAYAASHDLRTPLRGIADLSDWISEELGQSAPESVTRNIHRLKERARRMDKLVSNLLEYARAGTHSSDAEILEVERWLNDIYDLLDDGGKTKFSTTVSVPQMHVAVTPLSTVLRNLISNAIGHNDSPEPQVHVDVRPMGAYFRIDVSDNGPGVRPEHRERIFKLFQRLGHDKHGSGIGLPMVKRIVESHGGAISISARPDGLKGVVFSVLWPQASRSHDNAGN